MKYITKAAALTLALSCSVTMLHITPAQAGFLDFLRSNKAGQRPYVGSQSDRGYMPPAPVAPTGPAATAEAKPLPKVTGPRYYTYKPDAMRLVAAGHWKRRRAAG